MKSGLEIKILPYIEKNIYSLHYSFILLLSVCLSITVMLHQSWVKDWKQHNQHNAGAAGSNQA